MNGYLRIMSYAYPGTQLGNFERGAQVFYNRKDEITHGLSPSVKYVAPLFRDISLAKCEMHEIKLRPCAYPNNNNKSENGIEIQLFMVVRF